MSIGETLKLCRNRAELTQQELANLLRVERSTIAKIESGAIKYPSYELVKEWAKATNSEEIILLDFSGKKGVEKYNAFENTLKQIKKILEPVSFMRRRKV